MSQGPEQHAMWLSILKWSLSQTDGTSDKPIKPLSDADKEFLRNAFNEITKDEPKRLSEILKRYQDFFTEQQERNAISVDERVLEELSLDLEELRDIVEQIDMAHIVVKYRGVQVLLRIIEYPLFPESLKCLAAGAIGTITQNHPLVQDMLFDQEILESLVTLMLSSSGLLSSKILYAISCLIRGHTNSEEKFMNHYATSLTKHVLSNHEASNTATIKRLLFMIRAITTEPTLDRSIQTQRQLVFTPLVIPEIFKYILSEDVDVRDIVVKTIKALYSASKYSVEIQNSIAPHTDALRSIISDREKLTAPFDMTDEQDQYEKNELQELKKVL